MLTAPPRWRPVAALVILIGAIVLATPPGLRAYQDVRLSFVSTNTAKLRADSVAAVAAAEAEAKARGDSTVAVVFVQPNGGGDPARNANRIRLIALLLAAAALYRLVVDVRAIRRTVSQ